MAIRKYFREPFPGISHLVGVILSIVALIVLLILAQGRFWHVVAFCIYGLSSIILFLASTLSHSLPVDANGEEKFSRFDRAAIFGLLAGTYTPICLLKIPQPWGWGMLAVEWFLAILGILATLFDFPRRRSIRTMLYVIMGWLSMFVLIPLRGADLPTPALEWLFTGGILYTVGAVIFFTNWPNLWPKKFVAHDLWHVLVLLGSACFFVLIVRWVT
jgi:hemolysin III